MCGDVVCIVEGGGKIAVPQRETFELVWPNNFGNRLGTSLSDNGKIGLLDSSIPPILIATRPPRQKSNRLDFYGTAQN